MWQRERDINKLRKLDITCIDCSSSNITVFGSHQVFDEIIPLCFFLHNALHVVVKQIIQNLILHTIVDVYPNINFMNKGLPKFQKIHVQLDSS